MDTTTTISVLGATGSQGGGLVQAILNSPDRTFAVRALTRDVTSERARALTEAGAEVVQADLDDPLSLPAAFDGVNAAFIVTNYWAPLSQQDEGHRTAADRELAQADAAAQAVHDAGVRHVVWSTLEDTRGSFARGQVPLIDGKYTVPHFDAKAEADAFFRRRGVPTTFLRTTLFYEGLTDSLGPSRDEDGTLALHLPMGRERLSSIAVGDIGGTALEIFARPDEYIGRTVSIAGDHLTGEQYASILSDVVGERVEYRPPTWAQFRDLNFPAAVEMGNMFQFYAQTAQTFTGARDLATVRALNPRLQSFHDWAHAHAADFDAS